MSFIDVKDVGIQAVSHSRMKTHEGCPRKAMYKFIQKLKEPGNEAMERGLKLHKDLENYVISLTQDKKVNRNIPHDGVYKIISSSILEAIKGRWFETKEVLPEQQVAFDKDWNVTSWFGPAAWMRVVYDLSIYEKDKSHAELWDYKSGKVYDDHDQQADLYALSAFKQGYEAVTVKFFYLDKDIVQPYNYDQSEVPALEEAVQERAEKVTSDRTFPTNPSWRCKYCHFRRDNGGPCVH